MKRVYLMSVILASALLGAGCGQQCKEARDNILEPTYEVQNYLALNPSGANLQKDGCAWILYKFRNLPEGARTIRKIARDRFEHVTSYCVKWDTTWETRCIRGGGGAAGGDSSFCYDRPRRYCARREYTTHREPGYVEAMNLSTELDVMYARSRRMCSAASSGDLTNAELMARHLSTYVSETVRPHEDRVYAMACGQ